MRFTGPREALKLSAGALAGALVYAQPGGMSLRPAYRKLRRQRDAIRDFVHGGGRYLGFCLGAYLAGATPGFALLPGDTDQYIRSPGCTVHDTGNTLVGVMWRGRPRTVFFQDGPYFALDADADATVLATYTNGAPAAVVTRFGASTAWGSPDRTRRPATTGTPTTASRSTTPGTSHWTSCMR